MRYVLSDCEWSVIKPMLPNKPRGIPRVDDRRVLNGIFWALRSGAPGRTHNLLQPLCPLAAEIETILKKATWGRDPSPPCHCLSPHLLRKSGDGTGWPSSSMSVHPTSAASFG